MPMFKQKAVLVEADYFDGTLESAAPIVEKYNGELKDDAVDGVCIIIEDLKLRAGRWLVKTSADSLSTLSDELFEASYESA